MKRKSDPSAHLCRWPGCTRPWTTTFGAAPCCGEHRDLFAVHPPEQLAPAPQPTPAVPTHEPVRPFIEPADHEEDF